MHIEIDDLSRREVLDLLNEHLANMYQWSPPESVHALDIDELRQPDITFWSAWQDGALVGCGALKQLSTTHGEIKSMRTPSAVRRRGAGRAILSHIIAVAKGREYERLSLETGSQDNFVPARRLYESYGFSYCEPFGGYVPDSNSMFMTLRL